MNTVRIIAQRVVNMDQPEFDRLLERAGRNPSMEKILETARKDMTPPRRPRGEKPATTIRFLYRQIRNMEQELAALRLACDDKDKVIAGYDVQLSEAQETSHRIARSALERRGRHARELTEARADTKRLAFLEGYYAKSQETAPPRPIYAESSYFTDHSTEAHGRPGPGDSEGVQTEREVEEGRGQNQDPARPHARFGEGVQYRPPNYSAHPRRGPVEHVEITSHGPRDAAGWAII